MYNKDSKERIYYKTNKGGISNERKERITVIVT